MAFFISEYLYVASNQLKGEAVRDVYSSGHDEEKLNLNEASENFILKKIGDEDRAWDTTNKVFNITGDYPNQSNYIRIEMSDAWKAGLTDNYALPFGFYGPSRIKGFSLSHASQGVQVLGDYVNDLGGNVCENGDDWKFSLGENKKVLFISSFATW